MSIFTMLKSFLMACLMLVITSSAMGQVNVGYITCNKDDLAATAVSPDQDPIIEMLKADPNFIVDVQVVAADAVLDLSGYDVIVVQEGFSSGAQIFTPSGSLALEKIPVPFVYNKAYALRNGKAVSSAAATANELEGELKLVIPEANQSNPLFTNIEFDGDTIELMKTGADDNGGDTRTKAYAYITDLEMSDATTLLGGVKGATGNVSVCINDIPAGTVLGTEDTLQARMIAICQNFGTILKDDGTNLSENGLKLWKNAVYVAAGLEITKEAELMHSYTFETDASDAVGGVDGVFQGTATVENGALVLDANGDYISFDGAALDLNSYSAITMEYSFTGSAAENTAWNWSSYFGGDAGADNLRTSLGHWNDEIRVVYTGTEILLDGQDVNDGNVHHIVTMLTSDSLYYYEDGTLRASKATTGPFTIGSAHAYLGDGYWNDKTWFGSIYEFNIYDGVMSAEDIAAASEAFLNSKNASLETLVLDAGELVPAFDPSVKEYAVAIPTDTTEINITATAEIAEATLGGVGAVDVSSGMVDQVVSVTSSDGSIVTEYTIHFVTPTEYVAPIQPNIVSDPDVTDLANFAGWGNKSINVNPMYVYTGLTSGQVSGVNGGSIDVTLTDYLKTSTTYRIKAMVYIPTSGQFQIGIWGVESSDITWQSTTNDAWEEMDITFTTGESWANASSRGMFFNNYGLGSSLGYIDSWELYEVKPVIGYITTTKDDLAATAAQPDNDAIVQMVKSDDNFYIDVQVVAADAVVDLSGYDVVIAQEGFGSGSAIFQPGGSLALESIEVPFIYNKAYALRNGKAVTSSTSAAGEIEGELRMIVPAAKQTDTLFTGIEFDGDTLLMVVTGADDNGGDTRTKAFSYTTNLEMSNDTTLLAQPYGSTDVSVCINDIPAGTVLGTQDTLKARMIAISQNFGTICKDGGANLTDNGLTLWRNAIYSAAGIEIPSSGVSVSTEIASVSSSVGMATLDGGAMQLVLPAGTSTATLTVTTVDGNASVEVPTIDVADGEYETYEVVVTASVGGESATYQLDVHTQAAEEVLYVSSSNGVISTAKAYDTNVFDALVDAGYSVTFAKKSVIFEWSVDGINAFDYTPYAGMVLSGGAGSSNVNDYAKRNYPIPCVSMQNDGPKNNKWGWVNDKNSAQYASTQMYTEETAKMEVLTNKHYITGMFEVGDMIQWTSGTASDEDWAENEIKSYNLTDSIPEAVALASIVADGSLYPTMWAIPAGASVRSMNGDYSIYERVTTQSRVVLMYLFNDGLLYAADGFDNILVRSLEWAMGSGLDTPVQVGYITTTKDDLASTAASEDNDAVIQMLNNDYNFEVDVQVVAADATVDLSGYDVVIAQEAFGSGSAIFQPGGSLALESIEVPFIYNKAYALRNGKAVTSSTSSAGEIEGELRMVVPADKQSSPLFSGIEFDGDTLMIVKTGADDNGGDTRTKAFSYTLNLEMSDTTTLLGAPYGAADVSVCINDIPAGTVLGTQDTLKARMIAISQNFGTITKDMGSNMTENGLTLWRNAVYSAAGLDVPEEALDNTAELASMTPSVGTLSRSFSASKVAYQVNLPMGTTTMDVAAKAAKVGSRVKLPEAITLMDGMDDMVEVTVYSPVGNDSVVYTVYVHVQSDNEILYLSADGDGVGALSRDFDKNPYTMLQEKGYSVTFATKGSIFEWTASGINAFDYSPYKAMVIAGGESSGNVNDFAKRNYPIPCVTMQNDGPKNNKWGWVNDKKTAEFTKSEIYSVESAQLKITNVEHYITKNYAQDELVTWSDGTADDEDFIGKEVKAYNLTDSVPEAVALGSMVATGDAHYNLYAVEKGTSVRSMNGDYSTYERVTTANRVVLMYLFNDGLLYANDNYAELLERSLEWVTYDTTSVGVEEVEYAAADQNSVLVYPSPAKDHATFSFNLNRAEEVSLTVYNAIGQQVSTYQTEFTEGENQFTIGTADLTSGMYIYVLKAGASTYSGQMSIVK